MAPVRPSTTTYPGLRAVLKRCGLKERRIARHVGRKTWATLAAASGASHLQIGNVMHDTVATIEKSYVFIRVDKTHGTSDEPRVALVAPRATRASPQPRGRGCACRHERGSA
jgi:hypothetical protein